MLKTFCDKCEKPMTKADHSRVIRRLGKRFKVEIISCVDNTWNGGHLCHRCVTKIVNKGQPAASSY